MSLPLMAPTVHGWVYHQTKHPHKTPTIPFNLNYLHLLTSFFNYPIITSHPHISTSHHNHQYNENTTHSIKQQQKHHNNRFMTTIKHLLPRPTIDRNVQSYILHNHTHTIPSIQQTLNDVNRL